jgi:hypothetical protein
MPRQSPAEVERLLTADLGEGDIGPAGVSAEP